VVKVTPNDSSKVYALVNLSQYYSTSNLKVSIEYAEKAVDIARKSDNDDLISYAIFNAGNAYFTQGIYETATVYFYQYLEMQREYGNLESEAFALANIGAIMIRMEDFENAGKNFLEALGMLYREQSKQQDNHLDDKIPNILNNLGIVYQNLKQYDSALYYYREALKYRHLIENKSFMESNILNNIGSVYLDIDEADSAYKALSKAMALRVNSNDIAGQITSHNRLADYYLAVNKPQQALHHYYQGLKKAALVGSINQQYYISGKLSAYYSDQQNPDSALKYLQLNVQFKDSINSANTIRELTRLELTSAFREKERERIFEQKRRRTIYLFYGAVLVLFLLIFILLYVLSNNRNKRLTLESDNALLMAQNTRLENQNLQSELELKNKELTTNVMNMIRKNELIKHIADMMVEYKPQMKEDHNKFINNVIRELKSMQDDTVWQEFEIRYQQVHQDYFDKLNQISPNLSTNERRLCAFLKLDMTTKDIASITGQSVRSIEVARTRLRKKLQLTNSEQSLTEFLSSL
jgi:tetratricopeptide (TPR) repeat protein